MIKFFKAKTYALKKKEKKIGTKCPKKKKK